MPEATIALTVSDALAQSTERLAAAGSDTPRLDAELLLAHALGVARKHLVMERQRALEADELAGLDGLVRRRCAHEPVAYILGRKAFRHIELVVDPRVLIPRPETELLVDAGRSLEAGSRVVDVGTGSGAVALALKDERPDLEVWGTEASAGALDLARENARRLGLDVRFVKADLLEGIDTHLDAVLANLPYVELGADLAPEITEYEPVEALFAGADGLEVIRRLMPMLANVPQVALEVGAGQASEVAVLLEDVGFVTERRRDLAGHERVVVGRR